MTLMLLCAGEGTRLRPHTQTLPKPAIPFMTVPMAAYGLEWAREVSPNALVVNTYHLPEKIHRLFHSLQGVKNVAFSDEQPTLLGSGGGIKKAKSLITSENFLVMNGDEIFLPAREGQLRQALEKHRNSGALATMIVMKYPGVGTAFGGVWTRQDGSVLGFGKTELPGSVHGWHYIGAIFLSRRIFNYILKPGESNLLYDALVAGIAVGEKVLTSPVEGWWHETGNEKDYLEATAGAMDILVKRQGYEFEFLKSVLVAQSPDARFEKSETSRVLSFGQKVPANRQGFIVLGRGSSLAADSENENAVLGDGVHAQVALKQRLLLY